MATGKWVSDGQMEFGSGILKVFLVCALKTSRGLKEGRGYFCYDVKFGFFYAVLEEIVIFGCLALSHEE